MAVQPPPNSLGTDVVVAAFVGLAGTVVAKLVELFVTRNKGRTVVAKAKVEADKAVATAKAETDKSVAVIEAETEQRMEYTAQDVMILQLKRLQKQVDELLQEKAAWAKERTDLLVEMTTLKSNYASAIERIKVLEEHMNAKAATS